MNDKEAYKAVAEMMDGIFDLCIDYAHKDGLPYSFVLQSVGSGLIVLADKFREREQERE